MRNEELTPDQIERLVLLSEECGEVVQAIGKVLRHGYESSWGDSPTNRRALEREVTDFFVTAHLLLESGDISDESYEVNIAKKIDNLKRFTHFQPEELLATL